MVKKKRPDQEEYESESAKNTDNKEDTAIQTDFINEDGSEVDLTTNSAANVEPDKNVPGQISSEVKLAEMQDKYLRLSAEFDNYRKRTLREKMELSKYAGENLMLKIIPVIDDFERALKHMENPTTDCTIMKDGIDLIYTKFSEFLKLNGVKEIEALNLPFNVDIHEAVAKVPVQEAEKKGIVVDVISKGYYIQDKVLRFSKVVVGE